MLDFCFRIQRESIDIIEIRLIAVPYIVIKHMNKCRGWISWIHLIHTIPWFDLISSILLSELISLISLFR